MNHGDTKKQREPIYFLRSVKGKSAKAQRATESWGERRLLENQDRGRGCRERRSRDTQNDNTSERSPRSRRA